MAITAPTIAWPVQFAGPSILAREQGTLTAIRDSVARIGAIELGTLGIAPWLGLPAMELNTTPPDADQIRQLIERQEPSAEITVIRAPNDGDGWDRLAITVDPAGGTDGD